jgi:hypothetical protein
MRMTMLEAAFAAHRRRDRGSSRGRSSRAGGFRRRAAGSGAVSLCLLMACRGLVNYERSPEGRDAGSGTQDGGSLRAIEGPAPNESASSADAGRTAVAPEPASETEPEPNPPGEPPSLPGRVGSACVEDRDCSQAEPLPLTCITSQSESFPGVTPTGSTEQPLGGPAGGYCSRTCGGAGECGVGALCVDHSGAGAFCYAACSLTEATAQCVGGGPQACASVGNADGACYPMCHSHEQCGPGRFCDAASGLCVAEVQDVGGGIGAPCTLDSQAMDCRSGRCLYDLATGNGICTALCRSGEINCGAAAGEAARGSVCLSDDPSPGAVGSCVPLCDSDADCERSDYACRVGSPVAGRRGVCELPP